MAKVRSPCAWHGEQKYIFLIFAKRPPGLNIPSDLSFEVKLPLFEGPFDLLLFFIERDELDIYDIPISKITLDFLDYLKHLEQLNMDIASEFIWVAASLMKIKSKMLLPRPQLDEEGNEIDPREELVQHLLEYKKYKSVVEDFRQMEDVRQSREARGNVLRELKSLYAQNDVEAELQDLDLYKLLKAYEKAMERYAYEQNKPTHQVVQYPYTITGQKEQLLNQLKDRDQLGFDEVISNNPDKVAVIFNFLAILELLQMNWLDLVMGEGFNNFWIKRGERYGQSLSEVPE